VISAKKALDHVEPGTPRVGVKCKWKARMRLEPALHGRGLMSGIVVDDQMQVEIVRGFADRSA